MRLARSLVLALAAAGLMVAASAEGQTAPAPATWAGKDASGGAVKVPAEGQATILAFLRPGQTQTDDAIKVISTFNGRADVRIIAVVSGEDAAGLAQVLARGHFPGPVVVDTDYAVSGRFDVRVWPTTVIVNDPKVEGGVAGHIAGMPAALANDLAAYVDFATGKSNRAALDKALANREVVAESGEQRAARHVEVALRLAGKGMADEARAELGKAMELKPTDGAVLLSMARVDLVIGAPEGALGILNRIGEKGGVTAGEMSALKAWAAVEQGKWAEAKALLVQSVQLNPDPSEAYYLLGRVYEHDGETVKAAACYRRAFEKGEAGRQMGESLTEPK